MLRRASARTGREKMQGRESVWTDLPWLSTRAHGWRSSSAWVSHTAASIAGCQSLFTTLNDSDSVAKAFNWAGNGHPSSHFFIQVFFLTFKGHFVFPKFSFPACMNLKWIRTKSTRWVVMFPTIICSQGMNILYSKSDWRFAKKKKGVLKIKQEYTHLCWHRKTIAGENKNTGQAFTHESLQNESGFVSRDDQE